MIFAEADDARSYMTGRSPVMRLMMAMIFFCSSRRLTAHPPELFYRYCGGLGLFSVMAIMPKLRA